MFASKKILTALAFTASVNAAVLNIRNSSPERRAIQSCTVFDNAIWAAYSVWIGVPYGGSGSCDRTHDILEYGHYDGDGCHINNWECGRAGDGNTQLWFSAPIGSGDCVNSALDEAYPNVDGGFNCPSV